MLAVIRETVTTRPWSAHLVLGVVVFPGRRRRTRVTSSTCVSRGVLVIYNGATSSSPHCPSTDVSVSGRSLLCDYRVLMKSFQLAVSGPSSGGGT